MEYIFVYGTLKDIDVQKQLFGRSIDVEQGQLPGFKKREIRIPNHPKGRIYPIIDYSGSTNDQVAGQILTISKEELAIADNYEGPNYRRQRVTLYSGQEVWTYTSW